jgi:hypothetical protein
VLFQLLIIIVAFNAVATIALWIGVRHWAAIIASELTKAACRT